MTANARLRIKKQLEGQVNALVGNLKSTLVSLSGYRLSGSCKPELTGACAPLKDTGYNPIHQTSRPSIIEVRRGGDVSLQISVRESHDVAILDLKGKLITGKDGELLSKRLCESISNGKSNLLLNLGKLTQVDSSGVSIIARTHGSLKRLGGNLGLLRPSGHVLEVFRVLHLLEMIPSFEDEAQALASFQSLSSSQTPKAPEGTTLFR